MTNPIVENDNKEKKNNETNNSDDNYVESNNQLTFKKNNVLENELQKKEILSLLKEKNIKNFCENEEYDFKENEKLKNENQDFFSEKKKKIENLVVESDFKSENSRNKHLYEKKVEKKRVQEKLQNEKSFESNEDEHNENNFIHSFRRSSTSSDSLKNGTSCKNSSILNDNDKMNSCISHDENSRRDGSFENSSFKKDSSRTKEENSSDVDFLKKESDAHERIMSQNILKKDYKRRKMTSREKLQSKIVEDAYLFLDFLNSLHYSAEMHRHKLITYKRSPEKKKETLIYHPIHDYQDSEMYKCTYCDSCYIYRKSFLNHLMKVHHYTRLDALKYLGQ